MFNKTIRYGAKLSTLNLRQWVIVLNCWCVFFKWHLFIRFVDYNKWKHKLYASKPNRAANTNLSQLKEIIQLSELVARHHLTHMNCLRRCLTQKQLLDKACFSCQLHIGVMIESGKVKAHAWLTHNEHLINDTQSEIEKYSELTDLDENNIFAAFK